jgi:hypothetical protein
MDLNALPARTDPRLLTMHGPDSTTLTHRGAVQPELAAAGMRGLALSAILVMHLVAVTDRALRPGVAASKHGVRDIAAHRAHFTGRACRPSVRRPTIRGEMDMKPLSRAQAIRIIGCSRPRAQYRETKEPFP